jgi:hypothetical protein
MMDLFVAELLFMMTDLHSLNYKLGRGLHHLQQLLL